MTLIVKRCIINDEGQLSFSGVRIRQMAINGSRSTFPEKVDTFNELFDLPFEQVQNARRLTELKGMAKLTSDEQNELLQLTTQLKDYIITPETFNKFQDALVSVETFFRDNVDGYIDQKQVEWATYVNSFKYIGVWKTGVDYKFQNMVTDENGDLYLCKKNNRSSSTTKVTNTTYWQKASAKGEKGDMGINAILKGEWNNSTAYALGDAVRHNDIYYVAVKANTGSTPSTSSTNWYLLDKQYVGTTRPESVGAGLHFIKVVKEF